MPVPDFVLRLREKIGHQLLPMTGVTGVVLDDRGRLLLGRRADNGRWGLPSGILEPGEQPAPGLLREVEEETAVVARVEALVSVWMMPPTTYPNGDAAQYLDLTFRCRHLAGEPRVNDDESLEVGWFDLEDLPSGLSATSRFKLGRALEYDGTTWFASADGQDRLPSGS
ncbi:MAG TPA: NUDIX domain-containing protein [Segeticoccus sp.]|uniref:NUDIX hydrolase n=1 Tax=Segeticoccus sp. TaxID=2706531 RepID=UPI002D7E20FA|nr:NUDIX domain-containing protein [Segeticoccus sp.]HET8598688.1 NUDIX domain-containing protein [Segeticoccus sp.]